MSGMDFTGPNGLPDASTSVRKGAMDSVRDFVVSLGGEYPEDLKAAGERIARAGGTPLAVAVGKDMLGVIHLKDIIKEGVRERLAGLHAIGIRTVMITGDNRLTAATIAAEAGVTDYIAESRPEDKLEIIRKEQREGHLIGMIGDGTNDAPALAQADVGVAMASGTQTAREAGNMVDFDNHPAKVIDVVEVGKQLLITRGSLTTFSIANDVAKYFAILPAVFSGFYAAAGAPLGNAAGINAVGIANLAPQAPRWVPWRLSTSCVSPRPKARYCRRSCSTPSSSSPSSRSPCGGSSSRPRAEFPVSCGATCSCTASAGS